MSLSFLLINIFFIILPFQVFLLYYYIISVTALSGTSYNSLLSVYPPHHLSTLVCLPFPRLSVSTMVFVLFLSLYSQWKPQCWLKAYVSYAPGQSTDVSWVDVTTFSLIVIFFLFCLSTFSFRLPLYFSFLHISDCWLQLDQLPLFSFFFFFSLFLSFLIDVYPSFSMSKVQTAHALFLGLFLESLGIF